MTTFVQVNRLAKDFGFHPVFRDLTFQLSSGERVGLIGRNGTGKSTLMKIIAGREQASGGQVRLFLPPDRVGYLSQEAALPDGQTVFTYAAIAVPGRAPETGQVIKSLARMGFGRDDFDKPVQLLSGGEKSRLCLARLLQQDYNLLLLDEPTNHLDMEGLEWLEGYLKGFSGAMLVISHDRYFLDETVNRILEIERGELRSYPGNYSDYLHTRDEDARARWNAYAGYRRERKRISSALQRKRQWARQASAASSPRTPYLARRAKKVDQVVKSIEQRLERLDGDAPRKPWEHRRLRLGFANEGKTGNKLIDALEVCKAFGTRAILKGASFTIFSGEAAVLVGPNGAGKTTLLRLILGEHAPDRGRISLSPAARVGYMGQEHDTLEPELTVLETVAAAGEADGAAARHLLGALLFRGDQVTQRVATLSSGEKSRLVMAALLAGRANLLILDEPTNHLDTESREAIEAALDGFAGTILAVSHDRYFLHRLSNRVLALADGRLSVYPGTYSEYLEYRRHSERAHLDDILVLENRLSYLSGRLNELAASSKSGTEEMEQANLEFIEISRALRELKKER